MKGCGKPQQLDDFAAATHRILQTSLQNFAKFSTEKCGY